MTTLRRLLVAVYPIRLFLLALAVWGVAADVRAQSQVTVGYYDMTNGNGAGIPEQVAPIAAAGFTPVLVENFDNLAGIDILSVQNPSPNVYNTEYLAGRAAIEAAVRAGMVLIIHDRTVSNMMTGTRVGDILPGVTVPQTVMASKGNTGTNNSIEVTDATTLVANGQFGTITSMTLDVGLPSNHGHVNLGSVLFSDKKGLLHTGAMAGQSMSVTFTYSLGAGHVIYSTIPIDVFLRNMGMASQAVKDAFRNIYAPNVLTYAACGLKALPATVSATTATGHYGGTVMLTATVRCGVIPVSGVEVVFSLNGTRVGTAPTDVSGVATLANASLGSSPESAIPVGTYSSGVSAAFAGTPQYGASSATATLTVEKAPATITYSGGTFVYDGTPHAATGSVTGVFGEPLGTPSFTYSDQSGATTDAAPVNPGIFAITASSAETDSYLATDVSSSETIAITRASLTVTADDKTKSYGADLPGFTVRYEGFVPGETADVLDGSLHFITNATVSSAVGDYDVTPSGLRSDNYAIDFAAGTLTVSPAALTVHADDTTKVYGAPLPTLTASYEGFVLHERPDVLGGTLSVTTAAGAASAVGEYPIQASGLTSTNYAITFVDGTLDVTPAPLTVRAEDTTKRYGAALPAFTAAHEGFVLGETPGILGGSLTFTTPAKVDSVVGQYSLTPSGLTSSNYTISFVDGTVKVTPAPLKIRAENKERLIGILNPLLTVTYEGLVLGETANNLDGRPTVSTPAALASPAGLYPIVVTGAADANYTIEHVNGELTLSPEGRIRGEGWVDTSDARHHFVFDARETIVLGEKGSLTLRVDRESGADDVFISTIVTSVTFKNNPTVDPGGKAIADAVTVMGIGTWNGTPATFEGMAADIGEPGVGYDTVTIKIKTGLLVTTVVSTTDGTLNGGNVQSNRLPGR